MLRSAAGWLRARGPCVRACLLPAGPLPPQPERRGLSSGLLARQSLLPDPTLLQTRPQARHIWGWLNAIFNK